MSKRSGWTLQWNWTVLALVVCPTAATAVQGGGHQVTPAITEYIVAAENPNPTTGDFHTTGIPSVAVVNGSYAVAFTGTTLGSTSGLYYWDTSLSSPLLTFRVNDLVPGVDLGGSPFSAQVTTVGGTAPPAVSATGAVADLVSLSASSPSYAGKGIVRAPAPTAQAAVVANTGEPIEGTSLLVDDPAQPISIDSVGVIGFHSSLTNPTGPNSLGIVRENAMDLLKVAANGDEAPGASGGATSPPEFVLVGGGVAANRDQQWNATNTPVFVGSTTATIIGAQGVWRETGSGLSPTALSGEEPWGIPANNGEWVSFDWPSINNANEVAFKACVNNCSFQGVWAQVDGVEVLVADTLFDKNAPDENGDPTSESFTSFEGTIIGGNGTIAFQASTDAPGVQGIWIAEGVGAQSLRRVARTGDTVRGTSTAFSTFFHDIGIADNGQIAFTAILADGTKGLFVESETKSVIKLARTTESFELPIGGAQLITNINFYPGLPSQGVTGIIRGGVGSTTGVVYQVVMGGLSAVVLTTIG